MLWVKKGIARKDDLNPSRPTSLCLRLNEDKDGGEQLLYTHALPYRIRQNEGIRSANMEESIFLGDSCLSLRHIKY